MQPSEHRPGRLPARGEILTCMHFAIFAICSWSVRGFLFRLSSLMLAFDVPDLLSVFGYMMAFALLESLAVTAVMTALSAVLPSTWLRVGFAYKTSLAVLIAGIASIVLQNNLGYYFPPLPPLIGGTLAALLIWVVLVIWLQRALAPQHALAAFVERFAVFSYIYIPLGVVGMVVVLMRNLL